VKKKVNPRRIPLPRNAINRDAIIEEAIHYGSDHFDPSLFIPVRNGGLRQKELCAKNDRRNRFGFRLPPFSYSDLMGKLP